MIKDLYGRSLNVGDHVILKNVEAMPLEIVEMSEPITRPTPGGLVTIRELKLVLVIPTQIMGETGQMNAMRTATAEEMNKPKLVVQ